MSQPYNRIILIGNGLDLAAGLSTSYISFINFYIKNAIKEAFRNGSFDSNLISIKKKKVRLSQNIDHIKIIEQKKSAKDALDFIEEVFEINYTYSFMREIIFNFNNYRWVDLEQYYFEKLKIHFNKYEISKNKSNELNNIIELNECMDNITLELNNYLNQIQTQNKISSIDSPLKSLIEKCQAPLDERVSNLITKHKRKDGPENVVFLNFNYTNTINTLTDNTFLKPINKHIQIHGSINNSQNPIIFGYGDDTEEEYSKLESNGENELLRKIKSFQYPRTDNYHNLLNILSSMEYDVFIIGHSCGLSDKTLLKTIFEHKHCLCIQNFHYKGETEDFYKRMEISRHFSDKVLMRERILPYDDLAVIPQAEH